MIHDSQTNCVYISNLLESEFPPFYTRFNKLMDELSIIVEVIHDTNYVWCRDYMPIQTDKFKFVDYLFNPSYLHDEPESLTDSKKVFPFIGDNIHRNEITYKVEGGNVVKGENKIILTEGIFEENNLTSKRDKRMFLDFISKKFNLGQEDLIIIPFEEEDEFKHADGMVRLLNDDTVLVNDYGHKGFKKSFLDRFYGALGGFGLNIIQIPYNPLPYPLNDEDKYNASGYYINYLQVGKKIILPQFGDKKYNDLAIMKFEELFGKNVFPIDCSDICVEGGVLNCITWNIFREFDIKEDLKKLKVPISHYDEFLIVKDEGKTIYEGDEKCVCYFRPLKDFSEVGMTGSFAKDAYWKKTTQKEEEEILKELTEFESHIVKKKLIDKLLNN